MIAFVYVAKGTYSIASVETDGEFRWWCGSHGFVSPCSSYWAIDPSCWNEEFSTLAEAKRFATKQGFLK